MGRFVQIKLIKIKKKTIFKSGNDILDIHSNSLTTIHVTLGQLHCRQSYPDKYSVHLLFPCYDN